MRVLAVTNIYPTCSHPASGTFVEQQLTGLRNVGVDVDLMFVNREEKGIQVYADLRRRVRLAVGSLRPDIVHVMYGGVLADEATRAVGETPSVVSFCGSDLLGEHKSGAIRRVFGRYGVWASWQAARRIDRIIVKAKHLKDALPPDIPSTKVNVIPNGVDLDRFKPLDRLECQRRVGWKQGVFHLLFPAASTNFMKRFDLASAAAERVRQSGIAVELHQLANIPHGEVPLWLNASDVLLFTSLHEGSPNIVKEALACEIPVVSVDVGDVREYRKSTAVT